VNDPLVYSICLNGFPGANQALENLNRSTRLTRHVRLASTHRESPEIAFVIEWLRAQTPRLVLFGGSSPVYETLMRALRDTPIRFAVYWTSSGGQTDISQELPKFAALLESPELHALCFSSRGMADALRVAGMRALYLPPTLVEPRAPPALARPDECQLSLFCPPSAYRRKNILNTLLALAHVRGEWRLAVNGLSQEAAYAVVLRKLNIPYQEWGWMERVTYEEKLWQIGLGLQFAFAETFNYVAAEHLLRGIPVLAAPTVPVMDLLDEETRAQLVVPRADDIHALRERIQALVDAPTPRATLGAHARECLRAANADNIAAARRVLAELLETA
jgi:hypothetical protein